MGGHPASPCPAFQLGAGLQLKSTPKDMGGGAMPEQQCRPPPPRLPYPPYYLWLLVQRLLVHCRVRTAEISLLTMPEGGWKESDVSRAP